MEDQNQPVTPESDDRQFLVPPLSAISKWTRFISLVGFSVGAFVVMTMLVSGRDVLKMMATTLQLPGTGVYGILIFVFFLMFFVVAAILYFLYKASILFKQGIAGEDELQIAEGFVFLRRFFLVVAILGIIGLFSNVMKLFM